MLFCNTISLDSNSHGFPSRGGGGRPLPPPPTAKNLLIISHLKIFPRVDSSTYQRFIPPPLNVSFHKNFIINPPENCIFGCSHCSYTIFLSFNFILFVHAAGHANLDFNWRSIIQKVVYSLGNGLNGQNHSSIRFLPPNKNFPPAIFPIPPVGGLPLYQSLTLLEKSWFTRTG